MQKKRFFTYLVLTLMIGVFAFAFAIGQTVTAADGPVPAQAVYYEGGDCYDVNADGDPVLYDQLTGITPPNSLTNQDFEASFDAYDSEGADDFVVDGQGWHITGMDLCGVYSASNGTGPVNAVNVLFYDDNGGMPGSVVCDYTGTVQTAGGGAMPLGSPAPMEVDWDSTPCSLQPGTYWASIQIDITFGSAGQYFTSVGPTGNGMWRNPGNGFGTGCTDWASPSSCGIGSGENAWMFALEGTNAQPTDVNLSSFDGGSNSSVIAAIIVGIFSLGVAALVTIRYRLTQNQVN